MKKFSLVFIVLLTTFFSSCEKDLYEEAIVNDYNKIENKFVSIDKVPQLIPIIKNYNPAYNYLVNGTELPPRFRGVNQLDLNLQHIIEATSINNEKTYSVAINNYIDTNEKLYYENLHIIEKNGIYQTIILKYLPNDDSKEIDFTNFTGDIELYDINKAYMGVIQFENSLSRCVKVTVGCYVLCFFSNGEVWLDDSGCNGSSGDSGPSAGDNNNSGANNGHPGNSGTTFGGLDSGATNSGTNGGGSGTDIGNSNPTYSSSGSVLVPNTVWPADASNFNKSKLIRNKLVLTPDEFNWLQNNPSITSQIYTYLGNNLFSDEEEAVMVFVNEAIDQMINNPNTFSSINSFIIENGINTTNLNIWEKGIFNSIKNLQQNDVAMIIAKLGDPNSVYSLDIRREENIGAVNYALTGWYGGSGSNRDHYSYWIKIKPSYLNTATNLSVASTMIHEMVHAYFLSLIDDCNIAGSCQVLQTFPELWNYYVQYSAGESGISQHNQMAQAYVNIIATALQEYAISSNINSQPFQFYQDLAWNGLQGTEAYTNINGLLSPDDRIRIEKINAAEDENSPQYNIAGTILQYFPVGTPRP